MDGGTEKDLRNDNLNDLRQSGICGFAHHCRGVHPSNLEDEVILVLCPHMQALRHEVLERMTQQPSLSWNTALKVLTDVAIKQRWHFVNTDCDANIEKLRGMLYEAVEGSVPDAWRGIVAVTMRREV
jgi:hypothetical protein